MAIWDSIAYGKLTIQEQISLGYFRHVWEDLYRIPLESFKGPAAWRFMARFSFRFRIFDLQP